MRPWDPPLLRHLLAGVQLPRCHAVLSLEDPAYLTKVFFKAPLACLGLARWLPFNVGAVARQRIKDEQLLKFIDIECYCWSVMPADRTPMINAGMVFPIGMQGDQLPQGGVGVIAEKLVKGWNATAEPSATRRVTEVLIETAGGWREAGRWRGHPRQACDLQCNPLGHLSGAGDEQRRPAVWWMPTPPGKGLLAPRYAFPLVPFAASGGSG